MDITLEGRSREIIEHLVRTGQCGSPRDVVGDLLRWHDEKGRHTAALRAKVQAALAQGGEVSEEELDASLADAMEELKREGC